MGSIRHDCTLMMSKHCTELLVNVLNKEQQEQALAGFYEIIRAGLEYYDTQAERREHRLRPGRN